MAEAQGLVVAGGILAILSRCALLALFWHNSKQEDKAPAQATARPVGEHVHPQHMEMGVVTSMEAVGQGSVVQGGVVQGGVVQGGVVQAHVIQGSVVQGGVVQGSIVKGLYVQPQQQKVI